MEALAPLAPCRLRSFQVLTQFGSNAGGSGGEDSVQWSQSMGQLTLIHRPEGVLPERKAWSAEDIKVELSSKTLKVHLNGEAFKPLCGDFVQEVYRFKSWWVVEDETLIIRLFKRELGSWKFPFHGQTAGLFRRNPFPWRTIQQKVGMSHNAPGHGLAYAKDAPKEEELQQVAPGRPETEPGELRPDGAVEEPAPGGVFAMPTGHQICAAHDLCLGITAQQDDFTVTIEVHFEYDRYERLRATYPLEAVFGADVWPNAVCIFFQGDRMNPILWGELDGQVQAMASTWRITSSDQMRRRQAHGELYSPCLSLRLTKIRTPGTWNKIFSEVWQHKLMVKELGPFGAERFDGIKDGKTFLRAGYNLDDPDFWGNVDNYVTTAVKQSGYTSAPKKLAMA